MISTLQLIHQIDSSSLTLGLRFHYKDLVLRPSAFEMLPQEMVILRQHPSWWMEVVIEREVGAHSVEISA